MKVDVYHEYSISTRGKSAWGRLKVIEDAIAPLKMLSNYGYVDDISEDKVKIWWRTLEEL